MAAQSNIPALSADTLAHLGLLSQPFHEPDEASFAFFDAAHRTQLNVALQLLQAGDRMVVVRGEPGVGKSAFLTGLSLRTTPGLRFCKITGSAELTFEQLLQRLLHDCGLMAGEELPGVEKAAALLVDAVRAGTRPVLLIDCAQRLTDATLNRLLALRAATAAEDAPFGLALAVTSEFDARLEQLKHGPFAAQQLHTINLFPLTESQTADYVIHQLTAAGDTSGGLLTDADLQLIYARSQGVPGRIKVEALRLLNDKAGRSGMRWMALARRPLLIGAGVAALLAAGVGLWALLSPSRPNIPAVTADSGPYGVKMAKRYGFEEPAPQPKVVEAPPGLPLVPPPEPTTPATTDAATPPTDTPPRTPEVAAPAPQPAPPPAALAQSATTPPSASPSPPETPPAASAPQPAPAPAQAPAVAAAPVWNNNWLKNKRADHYTVQLIGAYDPSALQDFVREHGLEGKAAVIRTVRDGKPWYVVVTGHYATLNEAKAAIDKLPKSLRANGAFVRRIGTLRTPPGR